MRDLVEPEVPMRSEAAKGRAPEVNEESPFAISELFFSRTDKRGVINSYNAVFERVAEFEGFELVGAPHKLIRHSHMPRGAFWLVWNGLEQGHPVGAYVKNKSKSGRYYWVFAVISPVEGGYVSVRLKPSSGVFPVAKALYEEVLRREKADKLTPQQSADFILEQLRAHGFDSYATFQSYALGQEMEARRIALGEAEYRDISDNNHIIEATKTLGEEFRLLSRRLDDTKILTMNMKVQAAKLTNGKRIFEEISNNYELMLRDIAGNSRLDSLGVKPKTPWQTSTEMQSQFMLCTARLMEAMCTLFDEELRQNPASAHAEERKQLKALNDAYRAESNAAIARGIQTVRRARAQSEDLQRMVLGLSIIRISLRVEAGILRGSIANMSSIVSQLDQFHDAVEAHFARIDDTVSDLLKSLKLDTDAPV